MSPVSEIGHFLNLFQTTYGRIKDNVKQKISDDEFREEISGIITSFHGAPSNAFASHRFTTDADYLGHFYRLSTLSASIARNRIQAALEGCQDFRSCFDQASLKIVNVGGGANSDLVGLYSALYGNNSFLEMEITVMEKYGGWAPYSEVVDELLNQGNFGNASELRKSKAIACSFIAADLTNMTQECEEAFGEADIVWMKGFISSLQSNRDKYEVADNIISHMPVGALLVVMDSSSYFQYIESDELELIFFTDFGSYSFTPPFEPEFSISRQSNQEMRLYKKIG